MVLDCMLVAGLACLLPACERLVPPPATSRQHARACVMRWCHARDFGAPLTPRQAGPSPTASATVLASSQPGRAMRGVAAAAEVRVAWSRAAVANLGAGWERSAGDPARHTTTANGFGEATACGRRRRGRRECESPVLKGPDGFRAAWAAGWGCSLSAACRELGVCWWREAGCVLVAGSWVSVGGGELRERRRPGAA